MGVKLKYGYPLNTWVVEHVKLLIGKRNTPPRKEFPNAPNNKIATLVLC